MTGLIIAGFGGQGVLFAGKIIATAGMVAGKQVSWLPSYGPEMRGGTANCSVCLDDEPISCPIVTEPDLFLALNKPSYHKFIASVPKNGMTIYDSSLIEHADGSSAPRFGIPATSLAAEENLQGLANVILLGHTLAHHPFLEFQTVCTAVERCVPASKKHLLEPNLRALQLGYDYQK